jgi:hypothetical protein
VASHLVATPSSQHTKNVILQRQAMQRMQIIGANFGTAQEYVRVDGRLRVR